MVDESCQEADTVAIRKTNQMAHEDDGVDSAVVDVDDGLLIVFKR